MRGGAAAFAARGVRGGRKFGEKGDRKRHGLRWRSDASPWQRDSRSVVRTLNVRLRCLKSDASVSGSEEVRGFQKHDVGNDKDKRYVEDERKETDAGKSRASELHAEVVEGEVAGEDDEECEVLAIERTKLPRPLYVLSISEAEAMIPEIEDIVILCVQRKLANAVLLHDCSSSTPEMLIIASRFRNLCRNLETPLFIESRLSVAAALGVDGVQIRTIPGMEKISCDAARKFLQAVDEGSKEKTCKGGEDSRKVVGRFVTDLAGAIAADHEHADYIVIDKGCDPLQDGETRVSALSTIAEIRKRVSMHVIVSDEMMKVAGGPNSVLNGGGDGVVIPSSSVTRILRQVGEEQVFGKGFRQLHQQGRLMGAILLIAGGTVGAGIIALPVKTLPMGLLPSTAALTGSWMFMMVTALLLVELSLWYGPNSNLPKMADNTLGGMGKALVTSLYLFIYCATLTAYIAEGSNLIPPIVGLLNIGKEVVLRKWAVAVAFTSFMGSFVFFGTRPVDRLNSICMAGALLSYFALLSVAATHVSPALLLRADWSKSMTCLPIMVVAFTYHNIIPSLLSYLGTAKLVSRAILFGSLLPLGLYTLWQTAILGTIAPTGGATTAADIIFGIRSAAGPWATVAVQVFSLFAIITSFLGVALGCVDFVADLLGLNRIPLPVEGKDAMPRRRTALSLAIRRLIPLLMTLLPPFVIALACPSIFLNALEFSGTFRLVLFAIIPATMVWVGRYRYGEKPWLPGGRLLLLTVMSIACYVIGTEWLPYFRQFLPTPR